MPIDEGVKPELPDAESGDPLGMRHRYRGSGKVPGNGEAYPSGVDSDQLQRAVLADVQELGAIRGEANLRDGHAFTGQLE